MQETHFKNICSRLTDLLQTAEKSVDIAMAWFTNNTLFESLLDCLHRGVQVRVVLLDSPINFMEYAPDFNQFIRSGGKLYIATSSVGFMHHKFCVIDNTIVVSGSYNWTYYAETRNIENLFVCDDLAMAEGYRKEFSRLVNLIQESVAAPRLTMSEIEERGDVDYRELNEEIENICKVQNRPLRRVFETKTQVIIKETKLTPVAKWNIGILSEDNSCSTLIKSNAQLPYTSKPLTLYLDSIEESNCNLSIILEEANDHLKRSIFMEEDIMRVARGTSNSNLPIQFTMKLDDTGLLRIDVICAESRQIMTLSKLDKDLIKYE